jgi:hypothetical protein
LRDHLPELERRLELVRRENKIRQKIEPHAMLPVIGRVQPTYGEMHATLTALLKPAEQLRDLYRSLPEALLLNVTVSFFGEDNPALGLVIERLAEVLSSHAAQHLPRPGRQWGQRAVAQHAATYLVRFMNRRAPDAPARKRRKFIFYAMRKLGIDCPSLDNNPGDFTTWLNEVEAIEKAGSTPNEI